MLNDSYWKEYNDDEMASLWSANGETIAYIQKKDTVWDCIIYPELIAESFYYNGMRVRLKKQSGKLLFILVISVIR